jgi:hypothetical protein
MLNESLKKLALLEWAWHAGGVIGVALDQTSTFLHNS